MECTTKEEKGEGQSMMKHALENADTAILSAQNAVNETKAIVLHVLDNIIKRKTSGG